MDEAQLERAVEPFYSTKAVGKGTGLGLSMAHGLAAQSGGALTLESVVGIGTVASIWLPEAEAAKQAVKVHERNVVELKTSNRLRVLVVDDQDMVRKRQADMLSALGHYVRDDSVGARSEERMVGNECVSTGR